MLYSNIQEQRCPQRHPVKASSSLGFASTKGDTVKGRPEALFNGMCAKCLSWPLKSRDSRQAIC